MRQRRLVSESSSVDELFIDPGVLNAGCSSPHRQGRPRATGPGSRTLEEIGGRPPSPEARRAGWQQEVRGWAVGTGGRVPVLHSEVQAGRTRAVRGVRGERVPQAVAVLGGAAPRAFGTLLRSLLPH